MSAPIAVIDTGICNLRSVTKALEAVGASPLVVRTPAEVDGERRGRASCFPGSGALRDCVLSLRSSGLDATVREWIAARPAVPRRLPRHAGALRRVRGGRGDGAGRLPGRVVRFRLAPPAQGAPHGLEHGALHRRRDSASRRGSPTRAKSFYFVHSFHCVPEDRGARPRRVRLRRPLCRGDRPRPDVCDAVPPGEKPGKGLADLSQFRGISRSPANRRDKAGRFPSAAANFSLQAARF